MATRADFYSSIKSGVYLVAALPRNTCGQLLAVEPQVLENRFLC
jgi:hypothetical protein